MSVRHDVAAVALVATLAAGPAAAQRPSPPRTAAWGSVGIGGGFLSQGGDFGAHLEGSYQFGSSLVAVRLASAASVVGAVVSAISGQPGETAAHDFGLLFGRATPPAVWSASVAAGVGLAEVNRDSAGVRRTTRAFTVPVEGHLAWHPIRYVGVALCGFASVNRRELFGGVTVGVRAGRLR